jgi:hypothetical protein
VVQKSLEELPQMNPQAKKPKRKILKQSPQVYPQEKEGFKKKKFSNR